MLPNSGHFRGPRSALFASTAWKWVAGCAGGRAFGGLVYSRPIVGTRLRLDAGGVGAPRLRWGWLLFSLIPIFGTYYGRALRWAVFLRPLKARPSIRNLLVATVIGFTAITLFRARRGFCAALPDRR